MSKTFKIVDGDMSDGYHTFDELYNHRCLLFINLCLLNSKMCAWRPDFEGWFALYWDCRTGQMSYHIPDKYLYLVEGKIKRDDEHKWDGHKSQDVIDRLRSLARNP